MLVLARKQDEFIQIGPNIRIRVLEVIGGKVRLGIQAPSDLVILRGPELISEDGVVVQQPPPRHS